MSSQPSSDVHWLCPSCDAEPASLPTDGLCAACGSRVIEVRTRAEDLTGMVVDGRFEIRGLLGQGGMGAVYRAWQRSVGRDVAIKLIDERHGRDPMAVRRFLREARLASQLSQPNTVSVLDFGQSSDGRLFIAMELVRGRTLAEVLAAEGPFAPARAAWIGVQLCDALEAAHRLQIVHRDLKPANVVLLDDPPGRDLIKVLDFGLAKSLAESETKATDTGLVVGTPRYMAPEIILGERPTAQSDLYAVGVILGELATGKLMWDATSFPALAGQKLQGSVVIHELPLGLRGVVARLIDPEMTRRPASASEVRALLRPVVADAEQSAPMPAVPAGLVEGDRLTVAAPQVTPGAVRSPAPPIDPTLPQAQATAPGTRAARRTADGGDGDGDRASAPGPATSPASAAARATPMSDGALPAARRGRRGLIVGAAMAAIVAGAVVLVLARSSKGAAGRGDDAVAGGAGRALIDAAAPTVATDAAVEPSVAPTGSAATASEATTLDAGPAAAAAPATINLAIRSRPAGAEVTIDGKPAGTTPTTVAVPVARAPIVIAVRKGGLGARHKLVPDHDQALDLTLRGRRGTGELPF